MVEASYVAMKGGSSQTRQRGGAPAKYSDGRRPRGLGLAKPQDTPTINQIQMRIEGRDCSEDKVPRVWLATAGGSRHRDKCPLIVMAMPLRSLRTINDGFKSTIDGFTFTGFIPSITDDG